MDDHPGVLGAEGAEVERLRAEVTALRTELEAGREEVRRAKALSARTMAMYQQRALQMEIIRQQNEDLDRLAAELARAKKLEEERAREIENAARLKSEFLANFSHEIRTPLNGILGYCDLLTREEGSRLTPHGRRDLSVIKTNAKTLLALINDILDLSKIESGHVEIVREEVDLSELASECAATVREYLRGKAVELNVQIAPEAARIQSDTLKLRQILLNLLSNAAKFTEEGEILLDVARRGGEAVITVEDTGAGIPADKLPFIFEKFRQVDGSLQRKVGGTGLGLAIVRELTRLLDGAVTVTSEVGRGTKFTLRFSKAFEAAGEAAPASNPSPISADPTSAPRAPLGPGVIPTVLVVDDDPLVVQLVRGELEREGFRVVSAQDGIDAVRLAREHRPAAIVLDLHLPSLDGWSVLTRIKADASLWSTPVFLISVDEQRARGLSLGATEFLVKPFEPDQLVRLVSQNVTPSAGEVLVVDDDPPTRELVSRYLRRAGFSTLEARDGHDALLRVRVSRPTLVILDLAMPGLDGFEVLRRMRADDIQVPVVVLTGKVLGADEERALRDGIAAIVKKGGGQALDVVVAEARRVVAERQRGREGKLPRLLLVEDSEQNRDVVRRYLRGLYDLVEAEDGEAGLEAFERHRPELVLMDLSLPRLDGYEATRRIKAHPELGRTPVVVLTAHAAREDEQRARAAGCDAFLTKPVERDLLVSTIRKHLATRPADERL